MPSSAGVPHSNVCRNTSLHSGNDYFPGFFIHFDNLFLVHHLLGGLLLLILMQWGRLTIFLVNSTVPLQCETVGKCGGADVTLEGLQPGVNLFVVFQMGCLTERRLAAVTFVRFLAGVDAPMVPQGGVTGESFVTDLTNVWLFSTVGPLVVLQMWRLRELHSTRSTFVRLFARVDAHVVLQIDRLRERYPAHVALVVLFARVQLLVRPEAGVARKTASARVAGERLLGLVMNLRLVHVLLLATNYNYTRTVTFVTFCDSC